MKSKEYEEKELCKIEYRDKRDGKLKELWFDETCFYVQRAIDGMKEEGHTEFELIANPKNFILTL